MYHYKYFILLFLLVLSTSSCRKYVELEPQGKITPNTVNDYQLLLNNSTIFDLSYGTNDFPTDDIALQSDNLIDGINPQSILRIYKWEEVFYQANEDDTEWNLFYKQIYTANVAIAGLPSAVSGSEVLKKQLIAEAKVHRAYAYLCLVNLYARHFVSASAGTDPGVPLLTSPGYTQRLNRASVAEVYDLILGDLSSAAPDLQPIASSRTAPSRAAAHALLARAYLYMGNYAKSLEQADLCLAIQSTLSDLNASLNAAPPGFPFPGFYLPLSKDNPEVLLMKGSNAQDAPLNLSPELLNVLGSKDLRTFFYTYNGPDLEYFPGIYYAYFAPFEPRQEGPTVPEVMLIKAESLARMQRGLEGLKVVNTLRRARFTPADYSELSAATDTEALGLILQERRRELFGRGFRLFDLKRFNLEPGMAKTITHPLKTTQLNLHTGSSRLIYPIPPKVIAMNPEITQNPR